MAQEQFTDKRDRMNAPTYMRPQRSVLDEPLDIDAGKRVVLQPTAPDMLKETRTETTVIAAETPVVVADLAAELEVDEIIASEDVPVVDETAPVSAEDLLSSVVEAAQEPEITDEQAQETEVEEKPRRKGMTVFQQFIVLMLLLVVAALLTTIYLYTNGWIELPPAVLNLIEKGLSLIQ